MKLLIHAGLHKTASTAFQHYCFEQADVLCNMGVIYPRLFSWWQHGPAVQKLQRGEESALETLLERAVSLTMGEDGAILLSAEALEVGLFDWELSKKIEVIANKFGIDQIEWLFIIRNPGDYALSLYAQLAHLNALEPRCTLNFMSYCETIFAYGEFSVDMPDFRYRFCFDYHQVIPRFAQEMTGRVTVMSFEKFVEGFPGRRVLQDLRQKQANDLPEAIAIMRESGNFRLDPMAVERSYAHASIGIRYSQQEYDRNSELIEAIVSKRLAIYQRSAPVMRERIDQKFGRPLSKLGSGEIDVVH